MLRRHRVEADDDIGIAAPDEVEVCRRKHPAVHVAPPVDDHGVVEPRDRAGCGNRIGKVGRGCSLPAEHHPLAGLVVDGDDPEVGVGRPPSRNHLADHGLQRLGRDDSLGQPGDDPRRAVLPRLAQAAQGKAGRAQDWAREAPVQPQLRAEAEVGETVDGLPRAVHHHQPGWDRGREQGGEHRAGRGAEDVVGAPRIPSALLGDRVQGADHPGAAHQTAAAQDQARPRLRCHRGQHPPTFCERRALEDPDPEGPLAGRPGG
jgi:hypothetical protein